jgi:hypothetical protein
MASKFWAGDNRSPWMMPNQRAQRKEIVVGYNNDASLILKRIAGT